MEKICKEEKEKMKSLFSDENEEFKKNLSKGEVFYIIKKIDNQYYSIFFYPLTGANKAVIGYFMGITKDEHAVKMYKREYLVIVLSGLVTIMFIFTGFVYINERKKLEISSSTDFLTKLYNRSKFTELANFEMEQVRRYKRPISVIMIDIDNFKKINDKFGHSAGDEVLRELAQILLKQTRNSDIVARWGGEEFVCLLPNTGITEACIVAERMKNKVRKNNFKYVSVVSISLGVCEKTDEDNSFESVIAKADNALYTSKRNGKNRVTVWNETIEKIVSLS